MIVLIAYSCDPVFMLSGNVLSCTKCQNYLGVEITSTMSDDDAIKIQRNKLYSRGNMIISKFRNCSESVKRRHFNIFVKLSAAPQYGRDSQLNLCGC